MNIAMIGLKGIPATYGGVERHVEELAAQLVGRGHHVTAYCRSHYTPRHQAEHRGIRLKVLTGINTKHLDAISHTARAVLSAARENYDIIHFHAIGPALLSFFPRIVPCRHAKVVATIHSLDYKRRKWGACAKLCLRLGEAAALHFPHRTIVVSKQMETHFTQQGKTVTHIPNGVEAPAPRPLDELKQLGLTEKRFILWLGRFVPEKRVGDLITAFGQLQGNWKLLLAGEINDADTYTSQIKELAARDERIIMPGGLYAAAKAEALTNAALVVTPSELEGFPIALLEAMRYGRPVLASHIPEHLEAVQPGKNGYTCPLGDTHALADAMRRILDPSSNAETMGKRAADDAKQYDWNNIAAATEKVYADAMHN